MNASTLNTQNPQRKRVATRLFSLATIAFAALLATGCTSINYRPAVSLGESPQTIKATVKLEPFVDLSPPEDKSKQGVSVCAPGTLEGDLATDVTDAILMDFNNNQVFEVVKKRFDTEPDLVMKGTIHRFYGKFGPTTLMYVTVPIDIIWFFGIPIMEDKGEIDLEVSISRPDGTILGTYRGQSKLSDSFNMYENAVLGLPTRVNNAFSDSVAQIRKQMLEDEGKLSRPQVPPTEKTPATH